MKKIILTTAAVAALLTSAQADFSFADMFKDMKEAAFTLNKDTQDSSAKVSASNNTDAAHSMSASTQNAADSSKTIASK